MRPLICALAASCFLFSCKHEAIQVNNVQKPYVCDTSISFSTTVQPLLKQYCANAGCHDGGELPDLSDYTIISAGIQEVETAIEDKVMPPSPLPDSAYNNILCWIESGYKNN